MRFGSLCSGIEAASCAWHGLGWQPVFFSEIDGFASAVLAARWPDVPNRGDLTQWEAWPDATVDVLVAGTPCQGWARGGKGAGMDDPRARVALAFVDCVARFSPLWIVWENVADILAGPHAADFLGFCRALAERGYHLAYRVLNAAAFGLPMSRRRIFMVGHRRDARRAAAVLFDGKTDCDVRASSRWIPSIDASGLAKKQTMPERGRCWTIHDGTGHRFLMPEEVERAFGFPAGHTAISWRGRPAPDGLRYRALGNSMAVNVMRWIGERIQAVDEIEVQQ